jgi:radical SAM superfamily enzyme YgiQ (UPF0313 family)
MQITLVSTYELGHQPLHVAAPAAALRDAGHEVTCLDTSVEEWDAAAVVDGADVVAFSVPMHTAMRLAFPKATELKALRPDLPIALYGLYAPVSRDTTVGRIADAVFAGTYEVQLLAWVAAIAGSSDPRVGGSADLVSSVTRSQQNHPQGEAPAAHEALPMISLDRLAPRLPARDLLPPLDRYAHLAVNEEHRLVGYVEATQGCLLKCRHCPVPTVYGGKFRAVDREAVLADVDQLAEAGARHITFGDPDFLNGPTHALRVVSDVHARWPELTYDVTTKVDHIVRDPAVWETFAATGCLFVVSALETTNDAILERLDKGHTTAQASEAVRLLRSHGIEVRPSWMPFTPWTTLDDLRSMLAFVVEHDLVGNVEPVQYTIRLLLPEGSLLLDHPDLRPHLGSYDPQRLTWTWTAADPRIDALQAELADLVATRTRDDASLLETFLDVSAAVHAAADMPPPADLIPVGSTEGRPRLTEPWFC